MGKGVFRYRTESFVQVLEGRNRPRIHGVRIISKNGIEVAKCNTQYMANKIIKALEFYNENNN